MAVRFTHVRRRLPVHNEVYHSVLKDRRVLRAPTGKGVLIPQNQDFTRGTEDVWAGGLAEDGVREGAWSFYLGTPTHISRYHPV